MVSARYSGELWSLFNRDIRLTARNVLRSGHMIRAVRHRMAGRVIELDPGTTEPGTLPTVTLMLRCRRYLVARADVVGGQTPNWEDIVEIDIDQMIRKIGGVDQLEKVRAALEVL